MACSYLRISSNQAVQRVGASRFDPTQINRRRQLALVADSYSRQDTRPPAMAREQINRGRLRAQIAVQPIEGGRVCIFCPAEVSDRLHQHVTAKRISSVPPRRAMFGRYPQDELIVTSTLDVALAEVTEFVDTLPEICYERDVPDSLVLKGQGASRFSTGTRRPTPGGQ